MEAITRLKPRALEILMLHYKHGYSDVQIAKLLGTMQAPIATFVRTLNEVPGRFVRTLAAVRDQKEKLAAA